MVSKKKEEGYTCIVVKNNEILNYYNKKQVWLGVILKKKDLKADNSIDNFEYVKPVVMRTVFFDKYAVDAFDKTKQKYPYCSVFTYGNEKYVCPNSKPCIMDSREFTSEYVILSYRVYFHDELMKEVLEYYGKTLDQVCAPLLTQMIDVHISNKMRDLVESEQKEQKTRTR